MNIEIDHLTKKIKKTTIIDDISYTFYGGKIYGLSGKNGCGKTMLMRLIAGLIYPSDGSIAIDGKRLGKDISFPESIGVLIENPVFLNEYTGYQNLKVLADIQGKISDNEVREVLNRVGLEPDDKRTVYKYSLGMKQRLGIAAAIMGSPQVILLDEPINAIDVDGVSKIRETIRNLIDDSRVIIIACHDQKEMDYLADEKVYLSAGRILEETDKL
jgi:ABC-2 type transport system ATP-binding protein